MELVLRATTLRTDCGSAGSSLSHQSRACVSSSRRTELLPSLKFFRRQRLEEFRSYVELSAKRSRLATALFVRDWDEAHYRLGTAGNDNFFPATSFFDEARQLGLRFVNGNGFHVS